MAWNDVYDQQYNSATTDAEKQAVVAARTTEGDRIAAENDAWHKAHGTGPYAGAASTSSASSGATATDAATTARRTSAYDQMYSVLAQFGIDATGTGLAAIVKGWAQEDKSASWMQVEMRNTAAYKQRFPGMTALLAKGQSMSEAEYISQERSYSNIMQQWDLPKGFYDDPTDYGKFIANGVSVSELNDRITSAKTFLDQSSPSQYKQALSDMYGVSEGGMLAYVLDGDKAQSAIQTQLKASELAGAAKNYGFNLSTAQAEKYGSTLGTAYNAFGSDAQNKLQSDMATIGQFADQNARLAAIDNAAYARTDALDASLLSDTSKQLASTKRAQAEQARFSGTNAVSQSTFAKNGV